MHPALWLLVIPQPDASLLLVVLFVLHVLPVLSFVRRSFLSMAKFCVGFVYYFPAFVRLPVARTHP